MLSARCKFSNLVFDLPRTTHSLDYINYYKNITESMLHLECFLRFFPFLCEAPLMARFTELLLR